MPADRVYVGAVINGCDQFYQRETEVREGARYVAKPYFVLNRSEAVAMSEDAARMFVARLRSMRVHSAWIEDARDGRRIDLAYEPQQSGEDRRTAVSASIDDVHDYVVKPTNTPNGPKWFLRIVLPGITEPQVVYEDDPLSVLQRAQDLGWLEHAVKYERPTPPAPPAPTNPTGAYRKRPGDRFND